jgi:chromosome segregation ATPase
MNALLEDRVTVLEGKVKAMEANPQPGQNEAFSDGFKEVRAGIKELRADFKKFGAVQTEHTQSLEEVRRVQNEQGTTLAIHTGQLAKIDSDLSELNLEIGSLRYRTQEFRDETTGRLTRLDLDVAGLRGDVAGLKGDAAGLKGDAATLKGDAATLKGDVATLKGDVATLKGDMVEVKGALAEILDRLPAKGA